MAESFHGRTDKNAGKVIFDLPSKVIFHIRKYPNDTRVSVEIKKFYKKRTLPQNKYLHKVFGIIGDHLGYDTATVKDMMKNMFLLSYDKNDLPRIQKTSQLNTIKFEEFAEDVRRWAAEFDNMYIMTPSEYYKMKGIDVSEKTAN